MLAVYRKLCIYGSDIVFIGNIVLDIKTYYNVHH